MDYEEMLEQTSEAENVETQTTEENVEGIELTDTTSNEEETKEVRKTLKELLKEDPSYQEELNSIMKSRLDRKDKEYQRELSKYKNVENVLQAGLGTGSIEESEEYLRNYYSERGIAMPEKTKPGLTDKEISILAKAEADEIIESGDAEEEANKLATKGYANMNVKEKEIFNTLAKHLTKEKQVKELKEIGVNAEILSSEEFKSFAEQFNSNTSYKDIYNLYSQTHKEKKKAERMGSMVDESQKVTKDYYTLEEISKLTDDDLDDPKIWEIVRKSMTSQK